MTDTALRIEKMINRGIAPISIARAIGRPDDTDRVFEQAKLMKLRWEEHGFVMSEGFWIKE